MSVRDRYCAYDRVNSLEKIAPQCYCSDQAPHFSDMILVDYTVRSIN